MIKQTSVCCKTGMQITNLLQGDRPIAEESFTYRKEAN